MSETMEEMDGWTIYEDEIPGLITALRKHHGWSLSDMARQLHVSVASVWGWQHGKTKPQQKHLRELMILNDATVQWQVGAQSDEELQAVVEEGLLVQPRTYR